MTLGLDARVRDEPDRDAADAIERLFWTDAGQMGAGAGSGDKPT
jgi:hypothetical protein